jgi:hypothetical protein
MKKRTYLFVILIVGMLIFSLPVMAVNTIDYRFSIDTPIYEMGEDVFGDELIGNLSIGNSFQKSYGKVGIWGRLSGYPLEGNLKDPSDHLYLSGDIDWFEAGTLRGDLSKDAFGISYNDHLFGNENLTGSIENRWNFDEENTAQRLTLGYEKDLEDNEGTVSLDFSLDAEDLKRTNNATISVSYSGSFHLAEGKALNTSIIGEVYDKDKKPISGVTLNLFRDEELIKRVKTSQGGSASFGELESAVYNVQIVVSSLPDKYELTSSREVEVILENNEIEKIDFEIDKINILEKTTFSGKLEDN